MEQQKFRIPYMAGLAAELSDRVTEALSLSEPRIEGDIASHSGIICTSYDVLVNNAVIGTAQVTTYEQAGRTVIHNVGYRGRIPGYINFVGKETISLSARQQEIIDDFKIRFKRIVEQSKEI